MMTAEHEDSGGRRGNGGVRNAKAQVAKRAVMRGAPSVKRYQNARTVRRWNVQRFNQVMRRREKKNVVRRKRQHKVKIASSWGQRNLQR
mmetsp:Transcript_17786/g.38538  ORF Transcript_17786/g.38538 Transcript_17786/m.38538 type:complete len:89 (-) Transcript_17786:580-846(-)